MLEAEDSISSTIVMVHDAEQLYGSSIDLYSLGNEFSRLPVLLGCLLLSLLVPIDQFYLRLNALLS